MNTGARITLLFLTTALFLLALGVVLATAGKGLIR